MNDTKSLSCPGCDEVGIRFDKEYWNDQNAFMCDTDACGVYAYGGGKMPGA